MRNGIERPQDMLVVDPLQQIEQRCLMGGGELVDACEDQRPSAGLFQSGKSGEFRFGSQPVRNKCDGGLEVKKLSCGAGHEGRLGTGPELMQGAGRQHFAGTALSLDGGDAEVPRGVAHLPKEPLHDVTASGHLAETPVCAIVSVVRGVLGGDVFE